MRCISVSILFIASKVSANYDFSGLMNRIQKSTFDFDRRIEDTKNSEDSTIRSIELQERNVDRQLDAIREKFHLRPASSTSLLEKKRLRKNNHRRSEADDAEIIRDTELDREKAVEQLLRVEEDIGHMPERLFRKDAVVVNEEV